MADSLSTGAQSPRPARAWFGAVPVAVCVATSFGMVPLDLRFGYLTMAQGLARASLLLGVAAWWALGRWGPERGNKHLRRGAMTFAVLASIVSIGFAGGSRGIYFALILGLPFAAGMFMPGDLEFAAVTNLLYALGGAALVARDGRPLVEVVGFLALSAGGIALNLAGHGFLRSENEKRLRAEREHVRSLEALALAERRQTEAERLVLVGQLAASVAHEINNPLSFVVANLNWLHRELAAGAVADADCEVTEVVNEAIDGVSRIRSIVDDLRGFSRNDAPAQSGCEPVAAIDEALRIASVRLHGVASVRCEVPRDLPAAAIPRRHLVQVLINLLVNAGDAMEQAQTPAPCVRVDARASGSELEVSVEDNGPGIAEEHLGRIFEAFFTTKPPGKGTGLGLAVSRDHVMRAGGSLRAERAPAGGARFVITVPLEPITGRLAVAPAA